MVVKIVNTTGGTHDTKLLLGENDTDIMPRLAVTGLGVKFDVNGIVRAEVEIALVQTEIRASVTEWVTKHPLTQEYQRVSEIKFADGTILCFDERGDPRVLGENPPIVRLVDLGSGRTHKFKAPGFEEFETRSGKTPN